MKFQVFAWEEHIIEWVRSTPRSGGVYDLMYFVSDFSMTKWIILAVISFLLVWKGWRSIKVPLGLITVATILGDVVSRRIFKVYFMRPRPEFLNELCDSSACWGFISSHATNVFAALAVLCFFNKRCIWWTLPMATLVSFSRIYLLDHYPLDVMGGAAVGTLIGFTVCIFYQKIFWKNKESLLQPAT